MTNPSNFEIFKYSYTEAVFRDVYDEEEYSNPGVDHSWMMFSTDATELIEKDCRRFLELAAHLIDDDTPTLTPNGQGPYDEAGYFFWQTRCESGRGFWETWEWPKHGEELDEIVKTKFKRQEPYLGDDGTIYLM